MLIFHIKPSIKLTAPQSFWHLIIINVEYQISNNRIIVTCCATVYTKWWICSPSHSLILPLKLRFYYYSTFFLLNYQIELTNVPKKQKKKLNKRKNETIPEIQQLMTTERVVRKQDNWMESDLKFSYFENHRKRIRFVSHFV